MADAAFDRELKKGSAEMLILSVLEDLPRHGYEICKQIERRSKGHLTFHAASLYPLLYRLESRGLIGGRWVETTGRRRRFYRLTLKGRKALAGHRAGWAAFAKAIRNVAGIKYA